MVTIIQQGPGNTATDVLGALNAVLQGIQANRDKGQEQQLKLLEILSKQPGAQLEPVAPDQLQQPNFLDYLVGAQPRTLTGAPAARFGGSALTVGRLPLLGADPDVAALTKALTPSPAVSQPGPIIQTPMPLSNVTVPAAPTVVPTALTSGTATPPPVLSGDQQTYATMAQRIAKEEGVQNVPHFVGNIMQESTFNPQAEGRPTKYGTAKGLGGLIDSTAARYRVLDPFDPETNLRGSARYWKDLEGQFGSDPRLVAAAYNWGEQNLENAGRKMESTPDETQNHVRQVLRYASMFREPTPTTGEPSGANPALTAKADELQQRLTAEGIPTRITSTMRTRADQERLYAQGRTAPGAIVTNARPGTSLHETGNAFDIVPLNAQGQPDWNSPHWDRIGAVGKDLGLTWGGDFTTIKDRPHFELAPSATPVPASPPAPSTGARVEPPGAATGKVAGPGAPAPTPAQPVSADTDREAQLTQRRLDANPDARMVSVPGVGMRSQAWARDYLNRLAAFRAPGLYATPDNVFKYAEAKRKAADDLDKDEVQLRKDVQGAVEKHPGQEALFKQVRSQAELAGRVEQARSPGQLQTSATADLQSMLDHAPRDANGTYTPESLQAIARVQAYWGGYGVKPEAFKPQLDAAGVGAAEAAMKERAQLPVKQAEEQQRLRTQQEEDPFKGDEQASIIARNKSKEWGLPQSRFTKEMREIVMQEAAAKRAKDAGDIEAAKTDVQSFEKMDVYTRTALLGIVKEEGTPVSKYTAEQFRRAQTQGDIDKAHDEYLKQEALRQAKLNAPVTDAALLARYTDLKTGAKHPSEGESIPQMQAKGYVYLDKPQQDTLRNGVSSLRFVERMQTMLLGGTDYDGSFTGTPGAQFPGLYQAKKEATDVASRLGQSFNVRTGQIAGKTLAQWASIYDRLVDSSLGHIGREMGGERGHFTDQDAVRAKRFFADVGLTGKNLATSKPEAEKLFGQVRGLLNDRISSAVGVGRGEPLPWDPQAPQSQATRPPASAPPAAQGATPAGAPVPAPPQAAQESEADAYRRLTGQQPQRTP